MCIKKYPFIPCKKIGNERSSTGRRLNCCHPPFPMLPMPSSEAILLADQEREGGAGKQRRSWERVRGVEGKKGEHDGFYILRWDVSFSFFLFLTFFSHFERLPSHVDGRRTEETRQWSKHCRGYNSVVMLIRRNVRSSRQVPSKDLMCLTAFNCFKLVHSGV